MFSTRTPERLNLLPSGLNINQTGYPPTVMDDEALVASGQQELDVALRLLSEGVPLSLLIDLASPPHSDEIYQTEPGEADWLAGSPS